ncbi:hypothetical protein [uncultured Sphingomonas sp.]|uniref:hypothetical protein n=1 Tax=uncultured Sphingomonas sp. TaxID=158754 RepID=UPI0025D9D1A9|nr:hypothetical protein [uncultured Sphingomonas sp.]
MLRRRTLPMILLASALPLAACSPSHSDNAAVANTADVAELGNDGIANDDFGAADNAALVNDLLEGNGTAANDSAAR